MINRDILVEQYNQVHSRQDIAEHLNKLFLYGNSVRTITELGTGTAASTAAFALGCPNKITTIDKVENPTAKAIIIKLKKAGVDVEYVIGSSLEVDIKPTDILFIDTWHVYQQLKGELERHHTQVAKYIIMHDTYTFGVIGEGGGVGLVPALGEFLRDHPEWEIHEHNSKCNGLTVIKRIR